MMKKVKKMEKIEIKKLIAFDTEDNTKCSVRVINFFDGLRHICFAKDYLTKRDKHEAKNFIMENSDSVFCAHNLEYDLNNIFDKNDNLLRMYSGNRLIYAKYNERVLFMDSANHIDGSLDVISRELKSKKIEVKDFENVSLKLLKEHCKADCEIEFELMNTLQDFYNSYNVSLRLTRASNALQIFVKNFYDDTIIHGITENDLLSIALAFYGGRTEVFNKSKFEHVNKYDINSMYPYVMQKNYFPLPYVYNDASDFSDKVFSIINAKIICPKMEYPILPIRFNGRLIFPTGNFSGLWTNNELIYALENGYKIEKINSITEFPIYDMVFAEYVKHFYSKKEKETGIYREFYKKMLNSLYGKFSEKREPIILKNEKFLNEKDLKHLLNIIDGVAYISWNAGYSKHSNMIWSIWTTSYARILLHEYLQKYNAIYCDTDSIFTLAKINENIGTKIGQWKFEGNETAQFLSPKMYYFGEDYYCKGIPKDKAKEFFENSVVEFRKPIKWRESLKRRDKTQKVNLWITQKKELKSIQNDKRKFNKKTGQSIPLNIIDSM